MPAHVCIERGYALIECVFALALGGVLLTSALASHATQRRAWSTTLHVARAWGHVDEAMRNLSYAVRGAVKVRVVDDPTTLGHRLVLTYRASRLGRDEDAFDGIACAPHESGGVQRKGAVSRDGTREASVSWHIGAPAVAGESRERALYCHGTSQGNATPIVGDVDALVVEVPRAVRRHIESPGHDATQRLPDPAVLGAASDLRSGLEVKTLTVVDVCVAALQSHARPDGGARASEPVDAQACDGVGGDRGAGSTGSTGSAGTAGGVGGVGHRWGGAQALAPSLEYAVRTRVALRSRE